MEPVYVFHLKSFSLHSLLLLLLLDLLIQCLSLNFLNGPWPIPLHFVVCKLVIKAIWFWCLRLLFWLGWLLSSWQHYSILWLRHRTNTRSYNLLTSILHQVYNPSSPFLRFHLFCCFILICRIPELSFIRFLIPSWCVRLEWVFEIIYLLIMLINLKLQHFI